jgi:hypothetical protein
MFMFILIPKGVHPSAACDIIAPFIIIVDLLIEYLFLRGGP